MKRGCCEHVHAYEIKTSYTRLIEKVEFIGVCSMNAEVLIVEEAKHHTNAS